MHARSRLRVHSRELELCIGPAGTSLLMCPCEATCRVPLSHLSSGVTHVGAAGRNLGWRSAVAGCSLCMFQGRPALLPHKEPHCTCHTRGSSVRFAKRTLQTWQGPRLSSQRLPSASPAWKLSLSLRGPDPCRGFYHFTAPSMPGCLVPGNFRGTPRPGCSEHANTSLFSGVNFVSCDCKARRMVMYLLHQAAT